MENDLMVVEETLQPQPLQHISLFSGNSPESIIEEATHIANQLSDIIKKKELFKPIGQKNHVYVEGWTTLGALLPNAVFPDPEYSRRLDRENEIAYEAKVVVKTLNGVKLSTGEGFCSNKEANWRFSDEYAIKSMATTRATSKALRIPLGWIMTLAGYSATPAEEMTFVNNEVKRTNEPAPTEARTISNQPPNPKSPPPVVDGVTPEDENKILDSIDSEFDEVMPEATKVKNSEPDNTVDGEISPELNTDQIFSGCPKGLQVAQAVMDDEKPLTKKNINNKAVSMMPEHLTADDLKEINQCIEDFEGAD